MTDDIIRENEDITEDSTQAIENETQETENSYYEQTEPEATSEEPTYQQSENEVFLGSVPTNHITDEEIAEKLRQRSKKRRIVAGVAACAVLFGVISGAMMAVTNVTVRKIANSKIKLETTQNILTKNEGSAAVSSAIADIAEQCMPSIVSISNKSVTEIMTFFGTYQQENISSGSGIIIGKNDTELLIVTNYHVIADSQELSVIFTDSENPVLNGDNSTDLQTESPDNEDVTQAQVKGYDSDKDLAVISVKLESMPAELLSKIKVATIGDSSKLRAGEQVVAIGNALGYGQSVTTGIVSATNRAVTLESQTSRGTVTNKFIQTDAAINPGNSGGALLNMNGELVGINSVKIAANGVEGMGYAIPISDVESIIGELMVRETREVVDEDKQGFLGITIQDVSAEISKAYGMPQGVFVASVSDGSAAQKAGIKKGYIITKFDDYTVKTGSELQDRLTYYKAGEKKPITVQVPTEDGYEEKELEVTLDSKKEGTKKMQKEQAENAENKAADDDE